MILRRATTADAEAIGALHRDTMRISLPFLPQLHTLADVIGYAAREILPNNHVWAAEEGGRIVGYVAFDADWIHHLYVLPDFQGRGIGPQLLALALADGKSRRLWTFQQNARARRFYEARGFKLLQLTDGADNEERTPDALYEWRP
ncbi:MAG: GNAT family N-acetyltransferase [Caulobacterales bacterium]